MTGQELRAVFAANLRARRCELGLTQVELAEACGVPQGHISQLETGRKGFSDETLARLAAGLRTTEHALLTPGIFSAVVA